MDGDGGVLTKGGRGVRKEEEEKRKKLREKGELIPWGINKQRGTKSEEIPGPCG